jgi:hypothetical protein
VNDPRPPVLVIPGRERFHEVTLNVWAGVLGVAYVLGAPPPNSLAALMPDGWRVPWAAGLAFGGMLALLGSYWLSDVERGLEVERAGLIALTGGLFVYVVGVWAYAGWTGLMAGGIALAWIWANVRRSIGITRDLHYVRLNRADREAE